MTEFLRQNTVIPNAVEICSADMMTVCVYVSGFIVTAKQNVHSFLLSVIRFQFSGPRRAAPIFFLFIFNTCAPVSFFQRISFDFATRLVFGLFQK